MKQTKHNLLSLITKNAVFTLLTAFLFLAFWMSFFSATFADESEVHKQYPSFQKLVDEAKKGSTLIPPAGTYAGPVVIDKPLVIDGKNGVTIDAGGKGTVILLDTDGATIQNLRLTNSGESANDID